MTVFFAGGEMEAFIASSANVVETTAVGSFDPTYARASCRTGTSTSTEYLESPTYTSATTSWTHWESWQNVAITSGFTYISWFNTAGTQVFRLQATASNVLQPQYWNGASFTNIGTTFTATPGTRTTFDMKIICGASGSFEFFAGSVLVSSGSASMTSVTDIARFRAHSINGSATVNHMVSQVVAADVSTVGWKYFLKPPTGNGANTAWTGDFTAVDELVLSDADFVESTVANDVETFTGAALTIGSGVVKAVTVSGRSLRTATGPQNLQFAIRRGGTNYFTSNVAGLGLGFSPFVSIWATDPSTGVTWTNANAAAAATEFGVKSIT